MIRTPLTFMLITIGVVLIAGCASKAKTSVETQVITSPVRTLVSTCKPIDPDTLRAISGDARITGEIDEPARALEGDITARGDCNVSDIRRVVGWRSKHFLRCYAESKDAKAGRIIMRWEVTSLGKVGGLCLTEDNVQSVDVTNCIYRVIRLLRFAKPKGTCVVRWPLDFKRRGGTR